MSVIVPSRDSASGSSDKGFSLYWLADSPLKAAKRRREAREALEEVYSREAAEPHYHDQSAMRQQQHEHEDAQTAQLQEQQLPQLPQEQEHSEASPASLSAAVLRVGAAAEAEAAVLDSVLLDPAQLRERIASASRTSTSTSTTAWAGSHNQLQRPATAASASTSASSMSCFTELEPHHEPCNPEQQQQQQQHQSHPGSQVLTYPGLPAAPSPHPHPALPGHAHEAHDSHGQGHTSLNGAPLNGASLNGTSLSGAPLDWTSLSGTSLDGASLNGVLLNGAHLDGNGVPPPPAPAPVATTVPTVPAVTAPAATSAGPDTPIPGSIWILCCISAALTCASCVFNTALPIYMVSELKMSMRSMGMFEGLLEAFSYVVRMCSGVVSDRMTSRKAAITLGFAAGAAAKLGMASAGTVSLLFAGKAVDRLANGIQAAPRDALIGDLSPPGVRSACFGLAQSLRKYGSAVGALAAFFLMKASNNNYQLIFYSAAAVSLTATIAFVVFVPAHKRQPAEEQSSTAQRLAATAQGAAGPLAGAREAFRCVASMGTDFYRMLGVICLYALGHINESLLEARAMEVGFGKAEATLVVAALAAVTFLTAYPLGRLDDRFGAGTTFAVGISALIAGDLVLLLSGPHPMALFAACAFLGVHWAVIQGPLLSIVSGLAPANLRGTAFGIFYTVMAFTAVAANTMYGSIWHTYGANAAFATSAGLMSLVLAALPHMLPDAARRGNAAAAVAGSGGGKGGLMVAPLPAAA